MDDSTTSEALLLHFAAPNGELALVVEDDNRVAYAYLLQGEQIVGDVWLYNVAATPETAPWRTGEEMPFLNPAGYCKPGPIPRLTKMSIIQCRWYSDAVDLVVDGVKWAHLQKGKKPGWCRWSMREGPVARPLDP